MSPPAGAADDPDARGADDPDARGADDPDARGADHDLRALEEGVRGAFVATLGAFSLRKIVAEALPPLPPKRAVVRVIAAGKAAVPMMLGALDRWPDRVDRGLVVTVDGAAIDGLPPHVEAMAASHPIPDARSARASERALELARGLATPDLVVALVSGGASALLALPPEGFALDDKRALVRDLLESGATIREVNLVRRHCSRIKGGRLAEAAAPARVLTLAVSDVIGGGLQDIGSGPSVPDPTTLDEARAVLERFAPAWVGRAPLHESLKPHDSPRFRARVVAGPSTFAERLAEALRGLSLRARTSPPEEGEAASVAARRVEQARSLSPGEALVVPCEPTLRIPLDHGRGGRAGHVALRALSDLPDDVVLLCGATDGADGSSGAAGALVSSTRRSACDPEEIERSLAAFDDAPLHAKLGTRIETGPTGLNFADVHVIARLR